MTNQGVQPMMFSRMAATLFIGTVLCLASNRACSHASDVVPLPVPEKGSATWEAMKNLEKVKLLISAAETAAVSGKTEFRVARGKVFIEFESENDKRDRILAYKALEVMARSKLERSVCSSGYAFLHGGIFVGLRGRLVVNSVFDGKPTDVTPTVVQVLDEDRLICTLGEETLWVEGFPTAGIVDGKQFTMPFDVQVIGTKTYKTAGGGTRTAWHMKPLHTDAERSRLIEEKRKTSYRTWLSKDGAHKREAALLSADGTKAKLIVLGGSIIDVSVGSLSSGDQSYVRSWIADRTELRKQAIEELQRTNGDIVLP
tara:strand:+ start:178 stop:1119 length:942 start_codon:yes stop_codon:yes gene_type:complete